MNKQVNIASRVMSTTYDFSIGGGNVHDEGLAEKVNFDYRYRLFLPNFQVDAVALGDDFVLAISIRTASFFKP
ncbi:MAG: hypothetical protein IT427_15725 [Pirellulales bacterium]|nr:hypothetical protein [Pirellulales bacterium]